MSAHRSNILAPGFRADFRPHSLVPAFTRRSLSTLRIGELGTRIQLQQRNCSRLSRDSSIRFALIENSQRTDLSSYPRV